MTVRQQWTPAAAMGWYAAQPWRVGCNYIPAYASNQLEMWQAETFDLSSIQRELGWAQSLGLNSLRVFLHDLAWLSDPLGFLNRLDTFLEETARRAINPVLVFFDDCWSPEPRPGPQPAPIPGVHNSRWLQSPGLGKFDRPAAWAPLEQYLSAVLERFGQDERILAWDLYNEPGNSQYGNRSLPLLQQAFAWARAAAPDQPLTCGVWNWELKEINGWTLDNVDVVSFHHYGSLSDLQARISWLNSYQRPLWCTEFMSRGSGSLLSTHLPAFKAEKIACWNWGFVAGRSQTIYPWGSPQGAPEPDLWFHDLLRPDGTPYSAAEAALLRELTRTA